MNADPAARVIYDAIVRALTEAASSCRSKVLPETATVVIKDSDYPHRIIVRVEVEIIPQFP